MDEPQPRPYLAEWWPRVGATLLDGVLITVMSIVAAIVAAWRGALPSDTVGRCGLLGWFLIGSVYVAGTMARNGEHNGQTLGKQAAGIRVVRDDGRPIRLGFAALREVLLKYIVGVLVFGIGWIIDSLWPLGDKENRAIHDMIVQSHVVITRPRQPAIPQQQTPARRSPAPCSPRRSPATSTPRTGSRPASPPPSSARSCRTPRSPRRSTRWSRSSRGPRRGPRCSTRRWRRRRSRASSSGCRSSATTKPELALALREQLVVQPRMQEQLERFDGELERMVVELDTVRANLISISASGDTRTRNASPSASASLRDEMSAVSEGMDAGYRT